MKKIELAHVMGIDKFNTVYLLYQTIIETIIDVPGLYAQFLANRSAINDAIHWANVETQGKTKEAKIKQLEMAQVVIKYAHKGIAKARLIKNEDLINLM